MERGADNAESLEALAARSRDGSSAAFNELAARVSAPLARYLRGRGASPQDAEDLAQEALFKAYRNLHRYDPARPFEPWLRTIAARLAADHAERRGRERAVASLDHDPAGPAARGADAAEAGRTLWRIAAELLPARQYAALERRYAAGLSGREIASELGVTEANIKVMLFRARKRLAGDERVKALLTQGSEQ